MAATYLPAKAIEYARQFLKGTRIEDVAVRILDDANKLIWMAAPWRWTVGALGTVSLTASTTDYSITAPTDMLYLLGGYIVDENGVKTWIGAEPLISMATSETGTPNKVSFISPSTLRIAPPFGALPVGATRTFVGLYKKIAPVIDGDSQYTAGALVMDDEWFPVFEAAVLMYSYLYSNDQRAGSVTNAGQQTQTTGQMAVFQFLLDQMRASEPLPETQEKPITPAPSIRRMG